MSFYRQFRRRTVPILIAILLVISIFAISKLITYPSDTAFDWGPGDTAYEWGPGDSAYEWPPVPKKH